MPTSLLRYLRHPAMLLPIGGLTALAFAPFNFSLLALLAPCYLFFIWEHAKPRQAFAAGWFYNVGLLSSAGYWLYLTPQSLGKISPLLSIVFTVTFISVMSLYMGVAGWLYVQLRAKCAKPYRALLLFPCLWVFAEWWRGWFLTGFPWFNLGDAQLDSPLVGWLPLIGVYGVSLLVAASASSLLLSWRYRVTVIVLFWLGGAALQQIDWTHKQGEPFSIAAVQAYLSKDGIGNIEQLETVQRVTQTAWQTSDVVVWPETQFTLHATALNDETQIGDGGLDPNIWATYELSIQDNGQTQQFAIIKPMFETYLRPLEQMAKQQHKQVVLGVRIQDRQHGIMHNSLLVLDGEQRWVYDKQHLVPFGEIFPLRPWLNWLWHWLEVKGDSFNPPRREQPQLPVGQHIAGVSICYEIGFAGQVAAALPNADFLLTSSSDAIFLNTAEIAQHLQVARIRAIENGRWLVRAGTVGVTAVINEKGQVIQQLPLTEQGVLYQTVQPMQGGTPYSVWRDIPVMLVFVFVLIVLMLRVKLSCRADKAIAVIRHDACCLNQNLQD